MIQITVTGDTFPIRKTLNCAKFRWDGQVWSKRVCEAMLDNTLESIRPPFSLTDVQPKVVITLTSVDMNGERMREGEMRINLQPAGERALVDFLARFQAEVCDGRIVKLSPKANAPPKKRPTLDEGFF